MEYDNKFSEYPHGGDHNTNILYGYKNWINSFQYKDPLQERQRVELLGNVIKHLDSLDDPMRIVVAGGFNAGKSTFLNALVGRKIMPTFVTRTTGTANYLQASQKQEFYIVRHNGKHEAHQYNCDDELRKAIKRLMTDEQEQIKRIEIGCTDILFLKNFTLIDTPGLDHNTQDSVISEREVSDADVLIWVLHNKGVEKNDKECIVNFHVSHPNSPIIVIINRIDNLDDEQLLEVIEGVDNILGDVVSAVFPVSAKQAWLGKSERNQQKLDDSRFFDLCDYLNNNVFHRFKSLQIKTRLQQNNHDLLIHLGKFEKSHCRELEMPAQNIKNTITQERKRYEDQQKHIKQKLHDSSGTLSDSNKFHESTAIKSGLINILNYTYALIDTDNQWNQSEKRHLHELIKRIQTSKFRIGVFGSFSSGKSTLINTLLGHDDLLPVDEDRCTAVYTLIKQYTSEYPTGTMYIQWKPLGQLLETLQDNLQKLGKSLDGLPDTHDTKKLNYWVGKRNHKKKFSKLYEEINCQRDWDLTDEEIAIKQEVVALLIAIPKYQYNQKKYNKTERQLNNIMADKNAISLVQCIILYQDNTLLQHVEIIDSPGSGSVNLSDTRQAKMLVDESDALLFLTEATKPLNNLDEKRFLQYIFQNNNTQNQVFFLATKMDSSTKQPNKVIDIIKNRLNESFPTITSHKKIYPLSCQTGFNVDQFITDINQFLQEGKDNEFLRNVTEHINAVLNSLLGEYEKQLSSRQLDIDKAQDNLKKYEKKEKTVKLQCNYALTQEYNKITEKKYEIGLEKLYNDRRGKLKFKIEKALDSHDPENVIAIIKNHIESHIKDIVNHQLEKVISQVNKDVAEVDKRVEEILDMNMDVLKKECNISSLIHVINQGKYQRSFEHLLAFDIGIGLRATILKGLNSAFSTFNCVSEYVSNNVLLGVKTCSVKLSAWAIKHSIREQNNTNPLAFMALHEQLGDVGNDCTPEEVIENIEIESNEEIDQIQSTKYKMHNDMSAPIKKEMVISILKHADDSFNGDSESSIGKLVKKDFHSGLNNYMKMTIKNRTDSFSDLLEKIKSTLERQKEELNKSQEEKSIISKNREMINAELQFLKLEHHKLASDIENIYTVSVNDAQLEAEPA